MSEARGQSSIVTAVVALRAHRAAKLLEFLRTQIRAHGFAPSYQEIAVHLGLGSKSSVAPIVAELERMGKIRMVNRRPFGIELIPDADYHAPDCGCDGCAHRNYLADLRHVQAIAAEPPTAVLRRASNFIRLPDATRAALLAQPLHVPAGRISAAVPGRAQ